GELGVERGERGVPLGAVPLDVGRDLGLLRLELGDAPLRGLEPLHRLELDLLEDLLAPGELLELMLERLGVLRGPRPGVEPPLVPGAAPAHLLDDGLGLGDLPAGVLDPRAALDLRARAGLRASLELVARRETRQSAALAVE